MSNLQLTAFLNLASLFSGLAALLLAGCAVFARNRRRSSGLTGGSFCLCALSLLLQLAEIGHRANTGDFSAIDDTIQAVLFAASALFLLTSALNAAALLRRRRLPCVKGAVSEGD